MKRNARLAGCRRWLLGAAGGGAMSLGLSAIGPGGTVAAQTQPAAANSQEAVTSNRASIGIPGSVRTQGAIRGLAEQDVAAQREANRIEQTKRRERAIPGGAGVRGGERPEPDVSGAATAAAQETGNLGVQFVHPAAPATAGNRWLAVVASVDNRSPLAQAGLRPGDRIVSVHDQPVTSPQKFTALLTRSPLDMPAQVVVARNGVLQRLLVNPTMLARTTARTDVAQRAGVTPGAVDNQTLNAAGGSGRPIGGIATQGTLGQSGSGFARGSSAAPGTGAAASLNRGVVPNITTTPSSAGSSALSPNASIPPAGGTGNGLGGSISGTAPAAGLGAGVTQGGIKPSSTGTTP